MPSAEINNNSLLIDLEQTSNMRLRSCNRTRLQPVTLTLANFSHFEMIWKAPSAAPGSAIGKAAYDSEATYMR